MKEEREDITKAVLDVTELGKEIAREVKESFKEKFDLFLSKKRSNTVMTRLSDEDLKYIDIMIGIGLFESRSEAVAYLTHEGIEAKKDAFRQIKEKLDEIKRIREEARALLAGSIPKENEITARFCSNCGKELK